MGTVTKTLLTRREYDFSAIQGTSVIWTVAHRAIDVTHCKTAELLLRVHERTMTGTVAIAVQLCPVSLTPEDPAVDFTASEVAQYFITSSAPASVPALVVLSLTKPFGSHVQVRVAGQCDDAGPATIRATISATLVLKH
jgi:hypothetical protein